MRAGDPGGGEETTRAAMTTHAMTPLSALTAHLLVHWGYDDPPTDAVRQTNTSYVISLENLYNDGNYYRNSHTTTDTEVASGIKFGAAGNGLNKEDVRYKYAYAASNLVSQANEPKLSEWFGSVSGLSNFVTEVSFMALRINEAPGVVNIDTSHPLSTSEGIVKTFTKGELVSMFAGNSGAGSSVLQSLRSYYAKSVSPAALDAHTEQAYGRLRLLAAYQYIDVADVSLSASPVAEASDSGGYDTFIVHQLRKLTKVVVVAQLLRSASLLGSTERLTKVYNDVCDLPWSDETMLKNFNDSANANYLDTLYNDNVRKSRDLASGTESLLEVGDRARRVQDNLRAASVSDEQASSQRRRAYIMYVVAAVMLAALAAALGAMYAFAAQSATWLVTAVVVATVAVMESVSGVKALMSVTW